MLRRWIKGLIVCLRCFLRRMELRFMLFGVMLIKKVNGCSLSWGVLLVSIEIVIVMKWLFLKLIDCLVLIVFCWLCCGVIRGSLVCFSFGFMEFLMRRSVVRRIFSCLYFCSGCSRIR